MFGVERRGAPVMAFTRMDKKRIDIRTQIYEPDAVIVLDPTLLKVVNVAEGLKQEGIVIINSQKEPKEFKFNGNKIFTIDATSIAIANKLGSETNPIVNTAIVGAFSKVVGNVNMESVEVAIRKNAPVKKDENVNAAKEAFERVKGD
jgi:2-oxoacid:acceptor oxidoreductase gamma subunit (pyruvate/2-ketoisovalerate family)